MLQIKRMRVGQIGTNCYLLEDTDAKICAVVDPGDQPDDIDQEIRKAGLTLTMSTRKRSTGPGRGTSICCWAPWTTSTP